jgi:hypothetical protein
MREQAPSQGGESKRDGQGRERRTSHQAAGKVDECADLGERAAQLALVAQILPQAGAVEVADTGLRVRTRDRLAGRAGA